MIIRTKKHIFRLVNETIHGKDIITVSIWISFVSHCSRETQFTRMVPVTLHQDSSLILFLIQKRAYRRRATYGLQTPVHELCPRLGPIDTSSGWQVFGFILSNLRGNGKMHVDEQVSHRIF